MKIISVLVLFVIFVGNAGAAMTADQIKEFRADVRQGCINAGKKRGDKNAMQFCNCMDKVLRQNLSDADFDKIASYKGSGKGIAEIPVMKAILPKLEKCKITK